MITVITTIQGPTGSVNVLVSSLRPSNSPLIVIGDQKGPAAYDLQGTDFYDLGRQRSLDFALANALPTGHYSRKNLGYLIAMSQGAGCIYETDDDNAPNSEWTLRLREINIRKVAGSGWKNIYRLYTDTIVWPRGFALDFIAENWKTRPALEEQTIQVSAPVQQGLANHAPDTDAIWYLLFDGTVDFQKGPSILLPHGVWCPFNSQSTWWWPEAFPLLYLPTHCSFRMTDIWRGFIAHRCLWELGSGIVFHAPEVHQERNPHDYMRDFKQEMIGYTRNREMAELLEKVKLQKGMDAVGDNLVTCYEALVGADFYPAAELHLVEAWLSDLRKASASSVSSPK